EAREEENGQDTAERKVPPEPVTCDTVLSDELGDGKRGVGGKRGGDHTRAGKPPGQVTLREKELRRVLRGPPEVISCDTEGKQKIGSDQDPVDRGQHSTRVCRGGRNEGREKIGNGRKL